MCMLLIKNITRSKITVGLVFFFNQSEVYSFLIIPIIKFFDNVGEVLITPLCLIGSKNGSAGMLFGTTNEVSELLLSYFL